MRALGTINASGQDFSVPIVGEARYQDEIGRAARNASKGDDGVPVVPVALVREPSNAYDSNTVRVVDPNRKTLGYLSRQLALQYTPVLARLEAAGGAVVCQARVFGGTPEKPSLGVWLDLCGVEQLEVHLRSAGRWQDAVKTPPVAPLTAQRRGCLPALLAAFALLSLAALAGACATSSNVVDPADPAAPTSVKAPDLELVEGWGWERGDFGVRYIAGSVKNNSDRKMEYVQVTFRLLDASGAQVGSTLANTTDLAPGGVWKFQAVVLEDRATKAQVTDLTGF